MENAGLAGPYGVITCKARIRDSALPPDWWVKLWQRLPRGPTGRILCLNAGDPQAWLALAHEGWQICSPADRLHRAARARLGDTIPLDVLPSHALPAEPVDSLVVFGEAWAKAAQALKPHGTFLVGVPVFPGDVEAWRAELEAAFDAAVHLVDPEPNCPWLLAFGWKGMKLEGVSRSVLMVTHQRALHMFGGGETQLMETLFSLRNHGVRGDVSLSLRLPLNQYDLIHLFSLYHREKEQRLKNLPIPAVVSTIFWDYSELQYAGTVVRAIFSHEDESTVARLLDAWCAGSLQIQGFSREQARESREVRASQLAVLSCARLLLPNCRREVELLEDNFGKLPAPIRTVPNGVRPDPYLTASSEPFVRRFGLKDFVLCAGRLEPNKNQLMLVWALRDTGLPLVLAGPARDRDYAELCRKWARPEVHFVGELSPDLLASAYAAARVHVLPSWSETPGLVNLEAGLAGSSLVVGNRGAEREYLGRYAVACDPGDWRSIRQAVLQSWEDRDPDRAEARRQHILNHYTWQHAAAVTAQAYEDVVAESRRRSWGSAAPAQKENSTTPREEFTAARKPVALVWEGSQFVHHSLALVNRELCLQLIEAGCEISLLPYERDEFAPDVEPRFLKLADRLRAPLSRPAEVHVRHRWPPDFTQPPEGRLVMIQPWEFGSLPKRWVEMMTTCVDEVWVPSSYVRECYVLSGVPAERVHVVPNGVDPDLFCPDAPSLSLPMASRKRFKFLFVGGTIWRKGIDLLLQAYLTAFTQSDDVCLVIKDMGARSFYRGQTWGQTIAQIEAQPGSPPILYLDHNLPPSNLPGLYTACDCLVHPYRGEGFGLPIAEAMACGLPVIVTQYGAALDFCDNDTAYLIPATERLLPEKRIGNMETVGYPWVAEPDVRALAQLMRHVYEHPDEARARGTRASDRVRTAFTWKRCAARVLARLGELRHESTIRQQSLLATRDTAEAIALVEKRSVHMLVMPDWRDPDDRWRAAIKEFVREFAPHEDVGLLIRIDPTEVHNQQEIIQHIQDWAASEQVDLDAGHLILVLNDRVDTSRLEAVYRTSHVLVDTSPRESPGSRNRQAQAAAYGLLVCQPLGSSMRSAWESVRTREWGPLSLPS